MYGMLRHFGAGLRSVLGTAEHPRWNKFPVDLSQAIFAQHAGDQEQLMRARQAAELEGPPTRTERVKFIRRVVGEPESVAG